MGSDLTNKEQDERPLEKVICSYIDVGRSSDHNSHDDTQAVLGPILSVRPRLLQRREHFAFYND